jgi:hypothetical protein
MQPKIHLAGAEDSLSRILEAFEQEILDSSEEEIMEAAKELGMNPAMKGSAAFIDLKFLFGLRDPDLYDMGTWSSALDDRMAADDRGYSDRELTASRKLKSLRQAKDSDDK